MQAHDITLKDGSTTCSQGINPLIKMQAQNLIAENNSKLLVSVEEIDKQENVQHGDSSILPAQNVDNGSEIGKQESARRDDAIILHAQNMDLQQGSCLDPGKRTTMIIAEQANIAAIMKGKAQIHTKNTVFTENANTDLSDLGVTRKKKLFKKES